VGRPRTISDEHVLGVARRIFGAQGFGASTREIAREAGLSQAVLFQRFGDKSALFLAALVPAPVDISSIVGDLRDPSLRGSCEAVQGIASRLLDAMREIVPLLTALSTSADLDRAVLQAAHERLQGETLFANLSVLFSRWQRNGELPAHLDPERLMEALIVAVHGVLLMSRSRHLPTVEVEQAVLRRMIATIWGSTEQGGG
jgi:AcrR family transcriptional regulator